MKEARYLAGFFFPTLKRVFALSKPDFCKRCPVGGQFRELDQTCSIPDPEDGLPVVCVGDWSEEKHLRLRKYVDISRAARKKFVSGTGGATYTDMFCGPGRARIRGTSRIVDGSPLVAVRKALESGTVFSSVHVADLNPIFVAAVSARLRKLNVSVNAYQGAALDTSKSIVANLSPYALHFAFLDPYDLKSLPFEVIHRLAALERMDILIHVSLQDLQRNLRQYVNSERSPLDTFAPDWRKHVDTRDTDANVRHRLFSYWLECIHRERMEPSQGVEEVRGPGNQHLYWLVFVARHELALKFWDEIRNVTAQGNLEF